MNQKFKKLLVKAFWCGCLLFFGCYISPSYSEEFSQPLLDDVRNFDNAHCETLLKDRRKGKALFLRNIIKLAPDLMVPRKCLGMLLLDSLELGDYSNPQKSMLLREAIDQLEKAASLSPQDFESHFALAWALSIEHDENAIFHYNRTIEIKPDHGDAYYNLGMELWRKKLPGAEEALRKATLYLPKDHDAAMVLGKLLSEKGLTQDAKDNFNRAIKLAPPSQKAKGYYFLGLELWKDKDKEEAIKAINEAIRLYEKYGAEKYEADARTTLGIIFLDGESVNDFRMAVNQFEKVVSLRAFSPEALYNLGLAYDNLAGTFGLSLGEVDQNRRHAISQYEKANELDPLFPEAHFRLGKDLKLIGELNRSKEELETALKLNPNLDEARFELGEVSKALNEIDKAMGWYLSAAERNSQMKASYQRLGELYEGRGNYSAAKFPKRMAAQLPNYQTYTATIPVKMPLSQRALEAPGVDRMQTIQEGPYWNHWLYDNTSNEPDNRYQSLKFIHPHKTYMVNLHLAGIPYEPNLPKNSTYAKNLRPLLGNMEISNIKVVPVLLADPKYFKKPFQVLPSFEINFTALRTFLSKVKNGELAYPSDPLAYLAATKSTSQESVEFVFGELEFAISTREDIDEKDIGGSAAIGLSFWSNGFPIDEVSFSICISEATSAKGCTDSRKSEYEVTFSGPTFFKHSSSTIFSNPPEAAMHILGFSNDLVGGVLYLKEPIPETCEEVAPSASLLPVDCKYKIWLVSERSNVFRERLSAIQKSIGSNQNPDLTDKDYKSMGTGLVGLLFPTSPTSRFSDTDPSGMAINARNALKGLYDKYKAEEPFASETPRRFYVRIVGEEFPQPFLYPLGLLHLGEEDGGDESLQVKKGFLGYHFFFQTPLPRQIYDPNPQCIPHWIPVIPKKYSDRDMKSALKVLEENKRIESGSAKTFKVGKKVPAYTTMEDFRNWLKKPLEIDFAIISILSHHEPYKLWFYDGEFGVITEHFLLAPDEMIFKRPSIVLLDGCSTIGSGANDIARKFNMKGADAVIASSATIDGVIAGTFLNCFVEQVEKNNVKQTVEHVVYNAQKCTFNQIAREHARVLTFTLSGNALLQMCPQ